MTTTQIEDIRSAIARFFIKAGPGQSLALPFCTDLWKDETGRLHMQHNGISRSLFNETSDDIVAKLIRWGRA
jgi:hypothetical protein